MNIWTHLRFAGRGGKRHGAGRKPNRVKLEEEQKKQLKKIGDARNNLIAELHDPLLLAYYKQALIDAIVNGKTTDKAWALQILTRIFFQLPAATEENTGGKEQGLTIKDLLEEYERKMAERDSVDATTDVQSEDSEDSSGNT